MSELLSVCLDRLTTPIGEMWIAADEAGRLRATFWTDRESVVKVILERQCGAGVVLTPTRDPHGLTSRIAAYFAGGLAAIDEIPVEAGGTAFQRSVWQELRRIPCGTTIHYGELARRIRRPAAVRAVGLANGANPIGVVVPCHRVIGANGSLTGYGGGIERKRWLLDHERGPRLF
jgi:methylated-DNA-[protein]-cysteine S-methyltransferase